MKKTVTRILMAIMAATMLVCTATGCGGKKEEASASSAQSSVAASTEASVATTATTAATKSDSATVMNGDVTENIEYAYLRSDENGADACFLKLDDKSEFGIGGLVVLEGGEPVILADGRITEYKSNKNGDGSTTASFILVSENVSEGEKKYSLEVTEYSNGAVILKADGKSFAMTKTTDKNEIKKGMDEVAERVNASFGAECGDKTDAATIDCACKDYYASIVSGMIDEEYAANVKADKLPAANASEEERLAAAKGCTVKGALEYAGVADACFDFSIFGVDEYGTIGVKDEQYSVQISENTTFAEIYK